MDGGDPNHEKDDHIAELHSEVNGTHCASCGAGTDFGYTQCRVCK